MEKKMLNVSEEVVNKEEIISDKIVKDLSDLAKNIGKLDTETFEEVIENQTTKSKFKVCENLLPEKTSFWVKTKNILFSEIKIELTPYQQKIEDEINTFLYQDVNWRGVWNKIDKFLFQEINFGKKKL